MSAALVVCKWTLIHDDDDDDDNSTTLACSCRDAELANGLKQLYKYMLRL